jgi:hypothetical protein
MRNSLIVASEGMKLKPTGYNTCLAVIPRTVTPASYFILLRIVDVKGLRTVVLCQKGLLHNMRDDIE